MGNAYTTPPDKNLYVPETVDDNGMCFYDVRRAPFDVYGLYKYREEPEFKRMPDDVASTVSAGVRGLSRNTSGGRIRFCTDSPSIMIRAAMPKVARFPHMPLTGTSGFDLYIDDPETGRSTYYRTFTPPYNMTNGYDSLLNVRMGEGLRYYTIHFPTYNDVDSVQIGIEKGSALGGGLKYRDIAPVVFYGSSITQGGCSSRPGNAYTNAITRDLRVDHINLGFSGNGKAEDTMIEYLASLEMSVFVSDYDHNAPNPEHLKKTHYRLYEGIRAKQPDLPYIMVSKPDFHDYIPEDHLRLAIIKESYERAVAAGDKNVYFIDGSKIFRGEWRDNCTVDSTHPTDLGFSMMAESIGKVIAESLGLLCGQ